MRKTIGVGLLALVLGCDAEQPVVQPSAPIPPAPASSISAAPGLWRDDVQVIEFIKGHVQANYPIVVKDLEQEFGISYERLPVLHFQEVGKESQLDGAEFVPEANTILFSTGRIGEGDDLTALYNRHGISHPELRQQLTRLLRHELGHVYFDQVYIGLHSRYWQQPRDRIPEREQLLQAVIDEGIAEYISSARDTPPDAAFKDADRDYRFIYKAGEALVAPILKKDFHKGIRYLAEHPLRSASEEELRAYRARALENL